MTHGYVRRAPIGGSPSSWVSVRLGLRNDAIGEPAMGYIGFGLMGIVAGILLALGTDSPNTLTPSEQFGVLLSIAGVVAVLIGMVMQVVSVTRLHQHSR